MKMFGRSHLILAIDRSNEIQAEVTAERDRRDTATREKNARAKAEADAEYEANRQAWEVDADKKPPFEVKDGLLIRGDAFVFVRAIDSFHWEKGCSPKIDFRFMSFGDCVLQTFDGRNFERCYMPSFQEGCRYAFLRETEYHYYPQNAVLKVNAGGDSRVTIACPEYAREWVHDRFLDAIKPTP